MSNLAEAKLPTGSAAGATGTPDAGPATKPRTFVIYVEDLPGVLNRVSSLFRRRNYNIISLCVGRTHEAGVSRITAVVDADAEVALRIEANLYKLVNVLRVDDITEKQLITRDLALIKVLAGPEERSKVLEICEVYRTRVVDMCATSVIVEATGTSDKIQSLVAILGELGVVEMAQTGRVAMTRGAENAVRPELNSDGGNRVTHLENRSKAR